MRTTTSIEERTPARAGLAARARHEPQAPSVVAARRLAERPALWLVARPTAYALRGRRLLSLLVVVASLAPALALGLAIALVNTTLFLDPRCVFFSQERIGRDGRAFRIWKFRSMRDAATDPFRSWVAGDDGRVTRFGRLLRNTHLDELPQLWNVLRGDMDVIGPRPEMSEIDAWASAHVRGWRARRSVRPGMTGWAQITQGYTGMDARAYRHKLAADVQSIERASLGFDLAILGRTAAWVARGRGWRRRDATR
jgi:lipopolysaccharide/colanic/teichoic acid biosynthesis glycosyltransferase